MIGALLLGVVGPAAAEELCLTAGLANNRFHLQVTDTTVTSVGTVLSVVGIHRYTGEADLRNPVTGTIFIEPPPGPTHYRLGLLETGSPGTPNFIWNARLGLIVGVAFTNLLGLFTVDTMPAGMLLTSQVSGIMIFVNCQTGTAINF